MKDEPYSKYCSDNLILRDELAIDGTFPANMKTLLSYLHSAVHSSGIDPLASKVFKTGA
jgi:hypothetical protein